MHSRVEIDPAYAQPQSPIQTAALQYALVPENELETPLLPRDHPQWMRDAVAVSTRARQLLAALRPIAIRVLNFWDHAMRSVSVMGRRLSIDPSGCYRMD